METNSTAHKKHRSNAKITWIAIGFLLFIIASGAGYFWLKIYPLLNPRFKTPADFANNIIETQILCVWKERASDVEIKKLKNMKITAYTNRPQETDSTPNISASNRPVYEGSCAVSRELFGWLINFSDKIFIEEMQESFVVECKLANKLKDGTPIRRTIDIYMDKTRLEEAKNFRILNATVYVTIPRERKK